MCILYTSITCFKKYKIPNKALLNTESTNMYITE